MLFTVVITVAIIFNYLGPYQRLRYDSENDLPLKLLKHPLGTTYLHIDQLKLHEADLNQEQQDILQFYGNSSRWHHTITPRFSVLMVFVIINTNYTL